MKVAIVTGAKRGIGKAISEQLALSGINLSTCSLSNNNVEEYKNQIKNINPRIKHFHKTIDVRDKLQIQSFIKDTYQEFERIDYLINCAGVIYSSNIIDTDILQWENVICTNLKSVVFSTQSVIKYMKNNGGHIINISSIVDTNPFPGIASYCSSKSALLGFSNSIAARLKSYNIEISTISPGAVDTEIWRDINGDFDHSKMILPQEIGKTVIFLLNCNNGQNITITPKCGVL